MRSAAVNRRTNETDIRLTLTLEGTGQSEIASGIGFFDHMLTLFAHHGGFDLTVVCKGDIQVDGHHTVEDIGICLGDAFAEVLGDCRGVCRYGSLALPMDEALILAAVDLSGRGFYCGELALPAPQVGTFDTELTEEFFTAFCRRANLTLHLRQLAGRNTHHIIEGCFKAAARALKQAVAIDPAQAEEIPSTKGVLG
ncbi:MAG: imidazoleglycerol-phosphate dehydratase HisB [Clostridiaceae bacterium]|nr:imidazoleglycerol-phosphate dehydratase HisB [Clostridiaceae bacterium]